MWRKREPIPDFVENEANWVTAVYVVAPDILVLDDRRLHGIPFLFYSGITRQDLVAELKRKGIHYGETHELHKLKLNRRAGRLPDAIRVGNELISWHHFVPHSSNGPHVPYSFGSGHEEDIKRKLPVRTAEDFRRMTEEILPKVDRARMRWYKRLATHVV